MSTRPLTDLEAFRVFDPNTVIPGAFATYAQRRQVKFKMHPKRASALQTFSQYNDKTTIYEWRTFGDTARWVTIATKDFDSKASICDHCHASTIDDSLRPRYVNVWNGFRDTPQGWDAGNFMWRRRSRKLVEPLTLLFVCTRCARII